MKGATRVFASEGGAIYVAEKDGKYLVIIDESSAVAMLSVEDAGGLDPLKTLEFASVAERDTYLEQRYGIKTVEEK